jgi:hypothetical protein
MGNWLVFCSANDYGVSAQDIIPGDVNEAPPAQLAPPHPTSQLVDRVFVEKEGESLTVICTVVCLYFDDTFAEDGKGFVSQRRDMLREKDNIEQGEDLLIVDITTSDFALVCNQHCNPTIHSIIASSLICTCRNQ